MRSLARCLMRTYHHFMAITATTSTSSNTSRNTKIANDATRSRLGKMHRSLLLNYSKGETAERVPMLVADSFDRGHPISAKM